jgi:hypothetical protein
VIVRERRWPWRMVTITCLIVVACSWATPALGASDESLARSLVVTSSDVGPGYQEAPQDALVAPFDFIAECVKSSVREGGANVTGSEFSSADGVLIDSSVGVVSRRQARKDAAILKSKKFAGCIEADINGELTSATVKTQSLPLPGYGVLTRGFETAIPAVERSDPQNQYSVWMFKGRAEITVVFSVAIGAPFGVTEIRPILQKLAERLAQAPR